MQPPTGQAEQRRARTGSTPGRPAWPSFPQGSTDARRGLRLQKSWAQARRRPTVDAAAEAEAAAQLPLLRLTHLLKLLKLQQLQQQQILLPVEEKIMMATNFSQRHQA